MNFYSKKVVSFYRFVHVLLLVLFFSSSLLASTERGNVINHDQRPTDLEYALMSRYAYDDVKEDQIFSDLPDWEVYDVKIGAGGYKGVIFKNIETRQVVIAHRGTVPSSIKTLLEDLQSIIRGKTSSQELEIFKLIRKMVKYAKKEKYKLSFTGHSLGAFLAELSVFFCHNDFDYPESNAVTFESPGSKETLDMLQSNIEEQKIPLARLDIVSYVANPNLINTFNHHIGSLYQIEHNLDGSRSSLDPTWYTRKSHSIDNIAKHFITFYSSSRDDFSYYVSDWPIAEFKGLKEFANNFFKKPILSIAQLLADGHFNKGQKAAYFDQAEWDDSCNCYLMRFVNEDGGDSGDLFKLTYKAHYQVQNKYNSKTSLPLKHFNKGMQEFLVKFYAIFWDMTKNDSDRERLMNKWSEAEIPKKTTDYLFNFRIEEEKNYGLIVVLKNVAEDTHKHDSTPIHKFRAKLSKYLRKNKEKIKALLSEVNEGKEDPFKQINIDVALLDEGSRAGKVSDILINVRPPKEQEMNLLSEYNAKIRLLDHEAVVEGGIENIKINIGNDNRENEL